MQIKRAFYLILCSLFASHVLSTEAIGEKKQVFYLHGAIVEQGDPRPVHPKYGLYDYPAIVSALSRPNFYLTAERRAKDTDYLSYAENLSRQISELIANGTRAQDITIIGFSKGATITAIVSSLLKNDDVNFVIMASCNEWYNKGELLKGLRLRGHILSIYERSDELAGSCQAVAQRTPPPSSFLELEINTGKSHGAFFIPRREWLEPIVSWINRTSGTAKAMEKFEAIDGKSEK